MKEAAVQCLVCCVGCPYSVPWAEKELLSFRKECQCANLSGFEVIEELWEVLLLLGSDSAAEYCQLVLALRFRACLPRVIWRAVGKNM